MLYYISGTKHATLREHEHVVECVSFSNPLADETISNSLGLKEKIDLKSGGRFLVSGSRDLSIRFVICIRLVIIIINQVSFFIRSVNFFKNSTD